MNYQDNKKNIQDLLEIMKVEGRKPVHVEKMRELLILRDKCPPSPVSTKKVYEKKNIRKTVIPYPSLPPHIKRR